MRVFGGAGFLDVAHARPIAVVPAFAYGGDAMKKLRRKRIRRG
jgi:hypothetical protein